MNLEMCLKAVTKYGLATFAALVFGYILLGDVRADQKANTDKLNQVLSAQARATDVQGQMLHITEKILLVQRIQCINEARTEARRVECLREQ